MKNILLPQIYSSLWLATCLLPALLTCQAMAGAEIPELLTCADGSKVKTSQQWEAQRAG